MIVSPLCFKTNALVLPSVYNPANGAAIGSVPNMTAQETEEAVSAAYTAFQTWKQTTAKVQT